MRPSLGGPLAMGEVERMKFLLTAVVTLSFGAVVLAQQPAQQDSTPKAVIQGAGCVDSGVEAGCKVLKDSKTGDTYVLFFGGKEPAPGMAIWFKGAAHQGMTTCMQGKAADVSKWKRTKAKCPATIG